MNDQAATFVIAAKMLDFDPQHHACDHFVAAMRPDSATYSDLIPWLGGKGAFVAVVAHARSASMIIDAEPELGFVVASAWRKLLDHAPDHLKPVLGGIWPL